MNEMLGRVRLKENIGAVQMDEELPSLLEIAFKYLANNLEIVCDKNPFTDQLELRDGIVIPNEICDRFVDDLQFHSIYLSFAVLTKLVHTHSLTRD